MISRKLIIALLLLLHSNMSNAQDTPYFIKKVAWSDIHSVETVYQKTNKNYLLGANAKPYGNYPWKAYFVELDEQANVLQIAHDSLGSHSANVGKMVCQNDTCIMSAFHLPPGNMNSYSYFLTYQNGELHYEDIINGNANNGLHTCIITYDDQYLLAGYYIPPSLWHELYLVKLDADYNQLWDTVYYEIPITYPWGATMTFDYTYKTYFNDIVQGPGDTYYLLATADDNWGWDNTGFALLMRIDGSGNILWARHFDLGADEQTYSLLVTLDGGLLFTAVTDQTTFDLCMGYVRKLSTNGEVEWTWQAPAAVPQAEGNIFLGYPHKAIQLADSSYVITGDWGVADAPDSDGTLVKLSPSGGFQWQRSYGNPYNDYFYDLIVADHDSTGKHGYVVVGRTDSIGKADVWFLRLNCMGLLTEPQAAFTTYPTGNNPLEVAFVNQSQYVYPDSIDGGYYVWDFGDGSPPYLCGQGYAPCPDLLTHNYPAQGQFTAKLSAIVCSDTAVISQAMPVVWNGVGGAPLLPQLYVSPNPAKEVLHVVPTTSVLGSFCLYDVWGREVRRVALSAAPQTVSVSDLPAGVYFWAFYDHSKPNRALWREKVVVLR